MEKKVLVKKEKSDKWTTMAWLVFVGIALFAISGFYVGAGNPQAQVFIIWFQMFMFWAIFMMLAKIKNEIMKMNERYERRRF